MRWKASIKPTYQVGSIRSDIHFAILPKRIGSFIIWLKRYETVYVYTVQKVAAQVSTDEQREFDIFNWIKLFDREL